MKNPQDPTLNINVRLFRQVQRVILKWPESFNMQNPGYWMQFDPIEMEKPDCGSPACLFGWAVTLGDKRANAGRVFENGIQDRAASLLGLTKGQSNFLFCGRFSDKPNDSITAEEAARAIDRFIETKGSTNKRDYELK